MAMSMASVCEHLCRYHEHADTLGLPEQNLIMQMVLRHLQLPWTEH